MIRRLTEGDQAPLIEDMHSIAGVSTSVAGRIVRFNDGRDPERLRLKYRAMAKSAFAFFRGTCHLFWEDWAGGGILDRAPVAWACGDLHFENFGAFKGDNRLDYFDLNDFDESALAPCHARPGSLRQ